MKNKKTEKIWNWSWLIISSIMIIWNIVTIVQAIIYKVWGDVIFLSIMTLFMIFIFSVSLNRIKHSSKSKSEVLPEHNLS